MEGDSKVPPNLRQRIANRAYYRTVVNRARLSHHCEGDIMAGKQVSCDCGKVIRAETDVQLITDVQKHARDIHNMTLTPDQVLSMAEPM
jgi:predicted small metal-binding protein